MRHVVPQIADPVAWVTQAGIAGTPELDLLRGFCERVLARGVPISRALMLIDTLHPVHEGRVFRWRADRAGEIIEYGRTTEKEAIADKWRQSPFFHLEQTGEPMLRRRLGDGEEPEFPILTELRAEGQTDYVACAHRFSDEDIIGEMECVYSSWTTDGPSGF